MELLTLDWSALHDMCRMEQVVVPIASSGATDSCPDELCPEVTNMEAAITRPEHGNTTLDGLEV